MVMYADDTTLLCNIDDDININKIHLELNNISSELAANKLSLNTKKTISWSYIHVKK